MIRDKENQIQKEKIKKSTLMHGMSSYFICIKLYWTKITRPTGGPIIHESNVFTS